MLHGSHHVIYEKIHRFGRNGDRTTDDDLEATLSLNSIGEVDSSMHLGEQYYSSEYDDTVYVTEKSINSLDKRKPEKYGWLRFKGENEELKFRRQDFKEVYDATVTHCAHSEMEVAFGGTHSRGPKGRPLHTKYKDSISSAHRNSEGDVEMTYLSTIGVTLERNKKDFTLHTDVDSKVTNFTAVLRLDSNSNRMLYLTLNNTSGILRGDITAGNKSEAFQLLLGEGTLMHIHAGIALGCVPNDTTLCLSAIWRERDELYSKCSPVECETEALDDPDRVNGSISYTIGEKDSILNPRSWLKYANPLEWFNGVDSAAEGFIVAIIIIVIIILLSVIICFVRCLCCFYNCCKCCKCCGKNNRKRKGGDEPFRETNL